MGLAKISAKLDEYYGRLESGKAAKIKPGHVEKVIIKLRKKQELLADELQSSEKLSKKERVESKLSTLAEQIERAEWLLKKISK